VFDRAAFQRAFSSAGRRLGAGALAGRVELIAEAGAAVAADGDGPGLGLDALVAVIDACWRTGDNDERCAVLRALDRLPAPERFVPLAVSACRTNVVPVFEAIACDNAFPATHFTEPAFNQMVLKALFLGVATDRIVGLGDRITPELVRMAAAYASERRAAGRDVSADCQRLAEVIKS
jgi:hypothetical protein